MTETVWPASVSSTASPEPTLPHPMTTTCMGLSNTLASAGTTRPGPEGASGRAVCSPGPVPRRGARGDKLGWAVVPPGPADDVGVFGPGEVIPQTPAVVEP